MARKRRMALSEPDEGINLTPFIDVLFNLIFFFILATTLRDKQAFLSLSLPPARQPAKAAPDDKPWIVAITADQEIFLNDEPIDEATLEERLKSKEAAEAPGILIRGDAAARHERVVKALDICARAGLERVRIEVKPEDEE